MKSLNKSATKIFLSLIDGLKEGQAKKINNATGFDPVSIDFLTSQPYHGAPGTVLEIYAVAHRYEQNGDLVPSPDVEFYVVRTGAQVEVCPTAIDHGPMGYYRYVYFGDNGLPEKWNKKGQADLTSFCNQWMTNIKDQQGL